MTTTPTESTYEAAGPATGSSPDPEAIRQDIDRTRRQLADDVDTLGSSVSPSGVASRAAERAKGRMASLKEGVMGTAHDVTGSGSDAAHAAADTATDLPRQAIQQTRGNPLVAGAVALGLGWIVGSILPASSRERELASSAQEQAQPLLDQAKTMAQETAESLRQPATEAVQAVKETATDAAQQVRTEAGERAQDVRGTAQQSASDSTGS
jgi:cell division septum initiation protein DivIVA